MQKQIKFLKKRGIALFLCGLASVGIFVKINWNKGDDASHSLPALDQRVINLSEKKETESTTADPGNSSAEAKQVNPGLQKKTQDEQTRLKARIKALIAIARQRKEASDSLLNAAREYDHELAIAATLKREVVLKKKDVRELEKLAPEDKQKVEAANRLEHEAQKKWQAKFEMQSAKLKP